MSPLLYVVLLTGFGTVEPQREVSNYTPTLNDIESHLPSKHIYRDADKVTHAHESTHGVSRPCRGSVEVAGPEPI